MAANQYGKKSRLDICLSGRTGETQLSRAAFSAPFKVMKPFYSESVTKLMIISVSAGLMAGDEQEMMIRVEDGAKAEINTQSYEKIHRMPEGQATRRTSISVGAKSMCYYNPLPTIPFAGSAFLSDTRIELADHSSVLIYRDILCGGRAAHGEMFAFDKYENRVTVRNGERLLYYDNTILEPQTMELTGFGMMEGYTHLGTMLVCNIAVTPEMIGEVRHEMAKAEICGGISRMDESMTVIRVLGRRADDIGRYFDQVYEQVYFSTDKGI